MTDHAPSAYQEDVRERLEGLEPANRTGHRVDQEVRERDSGDVVSGKDLDGY